MKKARFFFNFVPKMVEYYSTHALIDAPLIDTFSDFLSNFRKNTAEKTTKVGNCP